MQSSVFHFKEGLFPLWSYILENLLHKFHHCTSVLNWQHSRTYILLSINFANYQYQTFNSKLSISKFQFKTFNIKISISIFQYQTFNLKHSCTYILNSCFQSSLPTFNIKIPLRRAHLLVTRYLFYAAN